MADFKVTPTPVDNVPPAPPAPVNYIYPGDVRSEFSA